MFVVGDFREYVCACDFRCIEFSLWLNHCYDYLILLLAFVTQSLLWLPWFFFLAWLDV